RGHAKANCIVVLPKNAVEPLPVVIYLYGSGGSAVASGNELRQLAEMGFAAVTFDFDETNHVTFQHQFAALLGFLKHQKWADTHRTVWVGYSLGAQRLLSYVLEYPDEQ